MGRHALEPLCVRLDIVELSREIYSLLSFGARTTVQTPNTAIPVFSLIPDMNPTLPAPDYVTEQQFWWPWNKFRLPPDALYTTLHERFNTRSSTIQEPSAFHRDVVECGNNSSTVEEFYNKLAGRKNERINEIDIAWTDVSLLLGGTPSSFSCPQCGGCLQEENSGEEYQASRWEAYVRYCRSMSADRLVLYFDEYARSERQRQKIERDEARRVLDTYCPLGQRGRQRQAESSPPTSDRAGSNTDPNTQPDTPESPPLMTSTTQFNPDDRRTGLPQT
ncbi:hypothetical protein HYQ44_014668 [Verticillium longisporum]|nr:hypothetical protein HYQ44_014668 [Verticillium longisporum]